MNRNFKIGIVTVFLIIAAVLPLLAVSYFGYNMTGGTMTVINGDTLYCLGPVTPVSNGTATDIEMYTEYEGANNVTVGIYSDSSGPSNLLKQSAGGTAFPMAGATDDWRLLSLTSSLAVTAGTNYWVCADWSGGVSQDLFYDLSSGHGRYVASSYSAGNLPATFPMSPTVWGIDWSIRVDYTPTAGGSTKTLTTLGVGN